MGTFTKQIKTVNDFLENSHFMAMSQEILDDEAQL